MPNTTTKNTKELDTFGKIDLNLGIYSISVIYLHFLSISNTTQNLPT